MNGRTEGGVNVRTARDGDVNAVLALWRVAAAATSASDDPTGVRLLLERDPEALLLAELDGRIVGTLIVGWDGWRGTLYRLAVLPEVRRRGIARRLLAEGERRLHAVGARRVGALVIREQDLAVSFWSGVGYERDERLVRFVTELSDRRPGSSSA